MGGNGWAEWIIPFNNRVPTTLQLTPKKSSSLKKLGEQVATLQKAHPQAQFEVCAYDEHRLGLQPVYRRMWAKRGFRPVISTVPRYEWLYLHGFVCPQSGQTHWFSMPTVNIEVFNIALAHFARDVGVSQDKHIALILDGAGWWHRSEKVEMPQGLHFIFLPPYSPELQPAEKLWPLTNEGIATGLSVTWTNLKRFKSNGV